MNFMTVNCELDFQGSKEHSFKIELDDVVYAIALCNGLRIFTVVAAVSRGKQ